jgi:hypothetical protein
MRPPTRQSVIAITKDFLFPILSSPSVCVLTPPSCSLAIAISRSRSVRPLLFAGKSRRMKPAMSAHPTVAAPSTMKSLPKVVSYQQYVDNIGSYHLHPRIPYLPSSPPVMAPASRPPKAPDRIAADIYIANRLDCSSRLYHDDMMRRMPGEKPDSMIPMKTRRMTRW